MSDKVKSNNVPEVIEGLSASQALIKEMIKDEADKEAKKQMWKQYKKIDQAMIKLLKKKKKKRDSIIPKEPKRKDWENPETGVVKQ